MSTTTIPAANGGPANTDGAIRAGDAPPIRFGDEQAMLLESAVAFAREQSTIADVRRRMEMPDGFEPALWRRVVELGWPGIAVPEQFGGSGLTLAEVATVAEPMGRHLMATPFGSTQQFAQALLAGGDPALQAEWLPRVCSRRSAQRITMPPTISAIATGIGPNSAALIGRWKSSPSTASGRNATNRCRKKRREAASARTESAVCQRRCRYSQQTARIAAPWMMTR